jgi:hypothetical protein
MARTSPAPEQTSETGPNRQTSRQRRIEEQRRKIEVMQRRQRTRQLSIVGLAVVAALVAVGAFILMYRPPLAAQGRQVLVEGQGHVQPGTAITWRSRPPSSGNHYERWSGYGVFENGVDPGNWVHNLEHGAIVVLFRPDLCDSTCVSQLRDIYNNAPRSRFGNVKMVVTPYEDMDHTIATVAWGWVDEMASVDRERIFAFYREHVDKGPEQVP